MKRPLPAISFIFMLLMAHACNKAGSATCADAATSLYQLAPFTLGTSVNTDLLQINPAYRDIVNSQFGMIKPETSYLLSKIHPQPGVYDFNEMDYLVDFCTAYHKRLEGANLMYQLYLPPWITHFKGGAADWNALAKDHIQTVVKRYKGIVKCWMVVNEALNEDGTLQNNIWLAHLGSNYILNFFRWAQEADPDADLFYNDFNMESNPVKLRAAIDLAVMLRNEGINIKGIGMQMHIADIFPSVEEINKAAWQVAAHDFMVYYSEWDISLNLDNKKQSLTSEMKQRQRDIVHNVVLGYRGLPAKYQYGISFWNVGDADSWIRPQFKRIDWPLLYDDNYQRKPAYCGFAEALQE